ncbi:hypothetical protein [Salinigranum sp. GCM10025319]|uniref:hypothetical protein n=1 Tax=Salinigranum sp. GCM10025319 TaxID=3252687 RepID=UPI003615A0E7
MNGKRSVVLVAALLVLTAFAPVAVAQETTDTAADLTLALTQDPTTGNATVTVTDDAGVVSDATVNVTSNTTYEGDGQFVTDADGTVDLPNPERTVEVTVEAEVNGTTVAETFTIVPLADSIDVTITNEDDGTALVEVTQYGDALDGASVTVNSTVAYAGNGTYTTDANGTVDLPEPEQAVEVTITAGSGTAEATTTAELSPVDTGLAVGVVQSDDGTATVSVDDDGMPVENATVNVTSDVAYDGNGTYESSAEGTVDLPAPEQNVTVTVTAENGTANATATADLVVVENGGYATFGQWVSSYVEELRVRGYFGPGFGQKVSEFVTENNPGAEKKPDHAGPKDDEDEENAEAGEDDERGPPDHAKGAKQSGSNDDTEGEASTDTASDDGDDCEAEDGESSCEDAEADDADADEDDAPGNSGDKGKSNGKSKGNGRGK